MPSGEPDLQGLPWNYLWNERMSLLLNVHEALIYAKSECVFWALGPFLMPCFDGEPFILTSGWPAGVESVYRAVMTAPARLLPWSFLSNLPEVLEI